MRENAVILTYPGHFYQTQFTIRSIREHIQPSRVIVLVDDWSFLSWDSYVNDCQTAYEGCYVVPLTMFNWLKPFEGNPWIRQQVVKLHLHKMLTVDNWFFSDGDIEFYQDIPVGVTPYTIATIPQEVWDNWDTAPLADKSSLLQSNYINKVLGVKGYWGLPADYNLKPNKVISTSGVPFRDMNKKDLQELENFIVNRHNKSLVDLHVEVMKDQTLSMSEWELMEAFKKYVKKQDLNMQRISPQGREEIAQAVEHAKDPSYTPTEDDTLFYLMNFTMDYGLGIDFFQDNNITVDKEVWEKIPRSRY